MGKMYTIAIVQNRSHRTVRTYADNLDLAIEKVERCKDFKVDVIETKKLYESKKKR